MKIKVNNLYDFSDSAEMEVFNAELQLYTASYGWSYSPETRILDLDISDEVDTLFLNNYGEVVDN